MSTTDAEMLIVNTYIIGAGNVGLGLALALHARGCPAIGLFAHSTASYDRATSLLRGNVDRGNFGPGVEAADLIVICVPDREVAKVAETLRHSGRLKRGAVVAHTSGCLGSDVLGTFPHAHTASIHPLVACPDPVAAAAALQTAFFSVEASDVAAPTARQLATMLGGRSAMIDKASKARYHAGAVMASNLVVALLHLAVELAEEAGGEVLRGPILELAAGAVQQTATRGTTQGLTGPVVRGDAETVRLHLEALAQRPDAARVYRQLSRVALSVATARGLAAKDTATLQQLLRD